MSICVAVTTYNSGEFVVETLESVFNQDFDKIELIISDDFSTDNTIAIVEEWIAQQRVQDRFDSIEFIKVPFNTGISSNCNRILNAAKSEFIKMIAGDDILYPNCLSDNMEFVKNNPNANIIFSKVEIYKETFSKTNFVKTSPQNYPVEFMGEEVTAQQQFKMLLVTDRIAFTPSFFFRKQAIVAIGGYNENNKLIEDYPMWLTLTQQGEKLYYFDKPTVGYRAHSKSLSNSEAKTLFKVSYKQGFAIKKLYVFKHLSMVEKLKENYVYFLQLTFDTLGLNKHSGINLFLYKLFFYYLNPFFLKDKFFE
jgi:glycosyltransferase involved in cell wall biosynthesis